MSGSMPGEIADQPVVERHDRRLALVALQHAAPTASTRPSSWPGMPFSSMTSGTRPATRSSISLQRRHDGPRCRRSCSAASSAAVRCQTKPSCAGQPLQIVVMDDDGHAVGRQMHVAFDGVAAARWRAAKADSVFSQTRLVHVVQAAMGDRPRGQPGKVGHGTSVQATSMMASISTGGIERQRRDADGRARMLAALAERCDQEIGCAVGDQMLLGEVRRRGDEDGDLDHAGDLFEIAERRLGLRQDVDRADTLRPPCRPRCRGRGRAGRSPAACRP